MDASNLQSVIDRQDIAELLARYVLSLDARDWDTTASCFLPEAVFVHPGGQVDGAAGVVARARKALEPLTGSQHLLGSVLVEVDGGEARATSYFHAQHVRVGAEGGDLYVIAGTYRDRLVRSSDGWKIAHRTQDYTWRDGNPAVIVR
jgi:3-phenylpropionate/cinnamic acid dioxygenase small subunit